MYQRGDDGFPVGSDHVMRSAWGKIPDCAHFQNMDGVAEVPAEVLGWEWSNTFARWAAVVVFANGRRCSTWPVEVAGALSC